MSKRTEILAYLAGIADGEAYIGIKKSKPYRNLTGRVNPSYHERVQIRMVERAGLDLFCTTLGGWFYLEKPHAQKGRLLWCYQASDLKAANILRVLLPYLRVKKRQAATVLRLRESRGDCPRIKTTTICRSRWGTPMTGMRTKHSHRTIVFRERLWLRCKRLNRIGA